MLLTGSPAVWRDAGRTMRAKRMLYDAKRQNLRAEEAASLRFPRANMDQGGWLLAGQGKTNATAMGTNQFVDITAAVLDFQMPATTNNRTGRTLVAQTNVVIVSVADQSRATADRAVYRETNNTLELTGHAVWRRGDQIMRGERLFFDNSNKVFQAEEQAYLKVPAADLRLTGWNQGGQSGAPADRRKPAKNAKQGTNAAAAAALSPQTTNQAPLQFIEVTSDRYEYRDEILTFQGRVNGRLLEGTTNRGTLTCGWLSLKFTSNRIERIEARQAVKIEQLPYVAGNGALATKKFESEYLLITMNTNGGVRRAVAATNVVIHKTELSPGAAKPKFSWLSAETTTADFFTRTNQVEKMVAEKNVFMRQDDRSASGDLAVYTATNNQVELTGNPKAEMPQMKIPSAQLIIWDRTHNRFLVDRPKVEGVVPSRATNAAPAIKKIDQSISTQTPPSKKPKKPTARPWR